jgi:hypothetical protein
VIVGSGIGFVVDVVDAYGNLVTNFNGTVKVTIAKNPGGSTLGGKVTVTPINGVATFSGLTLSKLGSGYILKVSDGSLTATTNPLVVNE